jgi:hypothetical protein
MEQRKSSRRGGVAKIVQSGFETERMATTKRERGREKWKRERERERKDVE